MKLILLILTSIAIILYTAKLIISAIDYKHAATDELASKHSFECSEHFSTIVYLILIMLYLWK